MAVEYQRRQITVDEYYRMAEAGIFGPDERLELVEGELIVMPSMNPPHFSSVARLTRLLVTRFGDSAVVTPQLPIRISKISEPVPDFAILHASEDFYGTKRAKAAEVYALVECADSSLRFDRGLKLRVYAKAGVAEYWIVNLNERCVEVHRNPHDLGYAERTVALEGDSLAFVAFPDCVFTVDEILGPRLDLPDGD